MFNVSPMISKCQVLVRTLKSKFFIYIVIRQRAGADENVEEPLLVLLILIRIAHSYVFTTISFAKHFLFPQNSSPDICFLLSE